MGKHNGGLSTEEHPDAIHDVTPKGTFDCLNTNKGAENNSPSSVKDLTVSSWICTDT